LVRALPTLPFSPNEYDRVATLAEDPPFEKAAAFIRQRNVTWFAALAGLNSNRAAVGIEIFDDKIGDLGVPTTSEQRRDDQASKILIAG
jgi:hypothetical protein